jgi:hypothetical protein
MHWLSPRYAWECGGAIDMCHMHPFTLRHVHACTQLLASAAGWCCNRYGWLVLSVELFTCTSSLAYAVLLCRSTTSRFTEGLPPARRNKAGQTEPVTDSTVKYGTAHVPAVSLHLITTLPTDSTPLVKKASAAPQSYPSFWWHD